MTAGKALAERTDLPATADRPGLAIWHSGPKTTQIRVAVAWPEKEATKPSYLRVWDTDPGAESLQGWEDDPFHPNGGLPGARQRCQFVDGRLYGELWPSARLAPQRRPQDPCANGGPKLRFPQSGAVRFRPVSLAVVSTDGGLPSHAAVILQPSADEDFRLALVDLQTNRVVADVPLRDSDRTQLPAIAARGRRVAVAAAQIMPSASIG